MRLDLWDRGSSASRRLRRIVTAATPWWVFAALVWTVSYRVAPSHGLLSYGDYPYFWPNSSFDGTAVVQTSFLGYVRMISMFTWALTTIPHLFRFLPPEVVSYLQTYGFLFGVAITYFIVGKRLTGSAVIGYVAGVLIVLNSVVLEYLLLQPSHVFMALIVYAVTVYVVLTRRDRLGQRHGVGFALLSVLVTHPFLWLLQAVLLVVLLLGWSRRRLAVLASTLLLMAVVAAYWLVPFASASAFSATEEVYAGNQASVLEGIRASIQHSEAFRFLQYPGDRDAIRLLPEVSSMFAFGLIAGVIAVYVWVGRREARTRHSYLLMFGLFVVAMHLGLGPNSGAIGRAWLFVYENVPGAGFLRTFTRFLNLALTALLFLVVLSLQDLRRRSRRIFAGTAAVLILASGFAHAEFFTGNLNGTVVAAKVPEHYERLNDMLRRDRTDFTVISYPNIPYEGYTWSTNSNVRAFPQITYFKEYFLTKPVVFNRLALNNLNIDNDYFGRLLADDRTFSFYSGFEQDLDKLDVKYVLVHKDLLDIQRIIELGAGTSSAAAIDSGRVDPQRYLDYFRWSRDEYRAVADNPTFALFENLDFEPRIRSRGAQFQKVGDTTYRVRFDRLSDAQELLFLQRFHPGWKLYVDPGAARALCPPSTARQCPVAGRRDRFGDLTRGLGRALEVPHRSALGYANAWTVSASELRGQLARDDYQQNEDGTIAVNLVVYFQPQTTFYAAALVSAGTVGGSLLFLVGRFWRRRVRASVDLAQTVSPAAVAGRLAR